MTTTVKTNAKKTVNANQSNLSESGKVLKEFSKSLSGIRSLILQAHNEGKKMESFTEWQKKYLVKTKKDATEWANLSKKVQFTKNGTTCGYWVLRTLLKFENDYIKAKAKK